jgi:hypothetical protein
VPAKPGRIGGEIVGSTPGSPGDGIDGADLKLRFSITLGGQNRESVDDIP